MSSNREEYTVPTGNTQAGFGTAPVSLAGRFAQDDGGPPAEYICGDCAAKVQIKRKETLRCVECGGRVLYKERTKRMVQFEAR